MPRFTLQPESQRDRKPNHILVTGNAAVDDSFLAGVDDDEGEVDDGIGRGRSVCLLLALSVSLDQIFESYLLWEKNEDKGEKKMKSLRNCFCKNSSRKTRFCISALKSFIVKRISKEKKNSSRLS